MKKVYLVLLLLMMGTSICLGIRIAKGPATAEQNPEWKSYLAELNKKEREEWQNHEQEKETAYIQINQVLVLQGEKSTVDLGLINPLYSGSDVKVVIRLRKNNKVIYTSPQIKPGTVIQKADLEVVVEAEEKAAAAFSFYDGRGKLVKEDEVEVAIRKE